VKRKMCVVTGTRAEYGLLYWIIKGIHDDPDVALQLIVTGMHLSPEFGLTVQEIERDGFPIAERVEMLLSSDTEEGIAMSMGLGLIGFANAYQRLQPDIVLVLGDRYEILAAAAAAVPFRIPVAHIHGGESTEGAMDEQFRHAITKMSHLHFPATQEYANRIIQMGEAPERVFCYGAPGLDNIMKLSLLDKPDLVAELGLPADQPLGVVTYHPVTLEGTSAVAQVTELLQALKNLTEIYWVFTLPNSDTGGRGIITAIRNFVDEFPQRGKAFTSLGQVRYLSLLKHAAVMVGNSSSGIIEAPSFHLPVVNIGSRQQGRIRAANVIDVPECQQSAITQAIEKAFSAKFKAALQGMANPYGTGDASMNIFHTLKTLLESKIMTQKRFRDFVQKTPTL
jgi:UDP-hydrolysing UDP-N-acetyl-D-glucosamine 2-epimerase